MVDYLSARQNAALLIAQAMEYRPRAVAIVDKAKAREVEKPYHRKE